MSDSGIPSKAPNYVELVRFLVEPFLDKPGALKIDCEYSMGRQRILLRVAVDEGDRGRMFGRGGRNIQAVRTVLAASAQLVGHSVSLDVFDGAPQERRERSATSAPPRTGPPPAKPTRRNNP